MSIQSLDSALHAHIFCHLESADLANCTQVSKEWQKLTNQNICWGFIAKKIFEENMNDYGLKQFVQKHRFQNLQSNEEIIERIQDFLEKITWKTTGNLSCTIGRGPKQQTLSLIVRSLTENRDLNQEGQIEYDVREHYYATGLNNGILAGPLPNPCYKPNFFRPSITCVRRTLNHHHIGMNQAGSLHATLSFPILREVGITEMEEQIKKLVLIKFDALVQQSNEQADQVMQQFSIAIAGLASMYFVSRKLW